MALKADGTIVAWGGNSYGEVGIGSTASPILSPTPVTGLADISAISAGSFHSMALGRDGRVWTWGWDSNGQLGIGAVNLSSVPVQVPNLTNVFAIDAGGYHSLALAVIPTNQPPVADAGTAVTIECSGSMSGNVTLDGSASSDPDGDVLSYSWTWAGGSASGVNPAVSLPMGATEVTLTVDDGKGGTASDTALITVADTIAPNVVTGGDVTLELESPGGTAFDPLSGAQGVDPCQPAVTLSAQPLPPLYPLGTNTVTIQGTDASGNFATANRRIIVRDTTPPVLSVPANVLAEASGVLSPVDIGQATAFDFMMLSLTNDAPAGGFPLGDTTVTWTAKDMTWNTTTAIQIVTVQDITAPTVTPPADVTIEATGPLTDVALGSATATDLVDGALTATANNTGPFTVGVHTITWSGTDSHGNTGSAMQTVTVTDTTPPVVTVGAGGGLAFQAPQLLSSGSRATSVTSDDFTNDGNADVVIANYDTSSFSLFRGDGHGGFTPGVSIGTPAPSWIDHADMNNDGKADLIVASTVSDTVMAFLGDGYGNFIPAGLVPVAVDPVFAMPFDYNNDGNMDIIAGANNGGWQLYLLQGDGNGNFFPASIFGGGSSQRNPRQPAIADFNGDGYADLLVPNAISRTATLFLNNAGTGSFSNAGVKASGARMEGAVAGDFNGDGFADVAISYADLNRILVLQGDGAGNFSTAGEYVTQTWPNILRTGDMNADGNFDIVAAIGSGMEAGVSVLLSNGDGSFQPASNQVTASFAGSLSLADFNHDGKLDATVSWQGGAGFGGAYVLLNGSGANISVEATGPLTAVAVGPASAFDLVDGPLTPTADNTGPFPLGTTTVTWSATDSHNNTGTAMQNVTVVDTTAPVLTAPADVTGEATGISGTSVEIGSPGVTDAFPVTLSNDAPALYPLGNTTVTWTATDANGNAATDTQTVTVVDTTAPQLAVPGDVTAEGNAVMITVSIGSATATDIFPVTITSNAPATYPLGSTTVTWTATDANGNVTTGKQTVTVVDTTAPVLSVPTDVIAEANAVNSTVPIGEATATDIFPVTITSDAPATYPLGTTLVSWTATDANGNVSSGTQTVTVVDTTAPVLSVPADVTSEANAVLSTVDIGLATASDIFGVTVTSDAPATFPLGDTTVTYTATDGNGLSTTSMQIVTVVDTTAPAITAPADVAAEAAGPLTDVAIGSATATDIFAVSITSDAPDAFPVGTTAVHWMARDANGNASSAMQTVTVSDTTAPVITVPADVTAEANAVMSTVVLGTASSTDLVDGEVSVSNDAPDAFPVGSTVVTYTATDAADNTGSATQTVTVMDTTAPALTVPADVTAEATGLQTSVDIGMATASDIFDVTITSDAPATYPLGTTLVTWTAMDANGNATTGIQSVTVSDSTAPTVTVELVPVKVKKHEGSFKVVFSASDLVDPDPAVTAMLNGLTVTNGQIVELKAGKKVKIKTEHGELELTAPSFELSVTATDASGNTGTGSAAYAFPLPKDKHDDNGIHRGNDKADNHVDSGNHKSEGKAKVEHQDNGKSDAGKSNDKLSDSKKADSKKADSKKADDKKVNEKDKKVNEKDKKRS